MSLTAHPKSFVFTTWEGGGCVAPALTAAAKLIRRGHRVRVMSDRCNRAEAEAAGCEFIPWSRAPSRPDRSRHTDLAKDWLFENPVDGLIANIKAVFAGPALQYAEDLIEELRREPADLVVTSEMLFGVMAGCEALGQRHVILTANVSLFPLPGVPPLGPGLAPAVTEADRALHAEVAAGAVAMMDNGLEALNAARAALGLQPLDHVVDQIRSADRLLLGASQAFDFQGERLPDHVRYVGPQLGEPAWTRPWVNPWAEDELRPLVLVSFSTTFQDHAGVVQRVIDALADLPVRGLVTLGESLSQDELTAAGNVVVVDSAPHDAVMPDSALVVTHGGHGTLVRALTFGRPLLVIPHGRDQNDNAVRVTHRGAGLSLDAGASTSQIRAALDRLLTEGDFTHAARTLGARIAQDVANSPVVHELEAHAAASAAPSFRAPVMEPA